MSEIKIDDTLGLCNTSTIELELPRISVDNKSDEYILVRTEDAGFVIVPPRTIYCGDAWKNSSNNTGNEWNMEYNIDNGKIDGIILNSGNIFKISDTGIISTNIRLKVKQGKKGARTGFYSLRDYICNDINDKLKIPLVIIGKSDFSGSFYFLDGLTRPGRWLDISDDKIKQLLKNYSDKKEEYKFSFEKKETNVYKRLKKIIYPKLREELKYLPFYMKPNDRNACCLYKKDYIRQKLWKAACKNIGEKDLDYIFLGAK